MATARDVDLVANLLQQGVREPHVRMKQRGRSTTRRQDSAMARAGNRLPVDRKVLEHRGFIGVKNYPPNGFLVQCGSASATPSLPGRPAPANLNRALKRFWDLYPDHGVPVMALTGATMGRDGAHDELLRPESLLALFASYSGSQSPIAGAAHFEGDADVHDWTLQFAELVSRPQGTTCRATSAVEPICGGQPQRRQNATAPKKRP